MSKTTKVEALEAKYGQKMIEVKVRFWTNDIAEEPGMIVPRNAWCSGVVRMQGNKSHAITAGKPIPFHSLLDIGSAIEKTLVDHDIQLHVPRRMKKYIAE